MDRSVRYIITPLGGQGVVVRLDERIVVGTAPDCDIRIPLELVDPRHAHFFQQGNELWIEDLGTEYGTFVNGERVERACLRKGDRILISTKVLKVAQVDP
jgi:pSer/pThr/pTyr-binding forkhead associated (FHA) protein